MYKAQFAKWRWSKYNKSGHGRDSSSNSSSSTSTTTTRTLKSRGAIRRRGTALPRDKQPEQAQTVTCQRTRGPPPPSSSSSSSPSIYCPINDPLEMEATLSAYGAYINTWSSRDAPWKTDVGRTSVLQKVRLALEHFRASQLHEGGEVLRGAFLQVEEAVCGADMGVSAIWDCCLAVPQLTLSSGWTDVLLIFTRYLDGLASVKLPPRHPLATVAGAVSRLARRDPAALSHYLERSWRLWVDSVRRQRGDADHVTIHLKRGYVILQTPDAAMVRTLIGDFGRSLQRSLASVGPARTTSRVLELEQLLTRMYLPLFTAESTARAERLLEGLLARLKMKTDPLPSGPGPSYLDRYLFFSAHHFLASICDFNGDAERAADYRRRSLDSPRDLFWLQTAGTLEEYLRAQGRVVEADEIGRERESVVLEPEEYQYPSL